MNAIKKFIIIINSVNRTQEKTTGINELANTSANFVVELKEIVPVNTMATIKFIIPNTEMNVNNTSRFNVSLRVSVPPAAEQTITLTSGQYTITSLMSELETQLKTVDLNFLASFNSTTQRATISNTVSVFTLDFTDPLTSTNIHRILGYNSTDNLAGLLAYVAPNYPILADKFMTLHSKVLRTIDSTNNIISEGLGPNYMLTIPINTSSDSFIINEIINLNTHTTTTRKVKFLDVILRNELGNVIDLQGNDIYFEMVVYSHPPVNQMAGFGRL